MKNSLTILLIVTTLCIAGAQMAVATPPQPMPMPATAPPAPAVDPNSVVVTVNGVNIVEGEVEQVIMQRLKGMPQQMPAQFIQQYKMRLRQPAIDNLIARILIDEEVQKAKIQVTDEEITKQIEDIAVSQKMTVDMLKTIISTQLGITFEQWKEQMNFRKGIGFKKFFDKFFEGKIAVTGEEVKKFYDENPKEFETPEQVRASHILIMPAKDPSADPNDLLAAAKVKAEGLLKQIKAGADFAELAKANSQDPGSAKNGGDLGFFPRKQMVPEFEKAAFALKPGQVSDLVKTSYGFHIIKTVEHKDAGITKLDEASMAIMDKLKSDKQQELLNNFIEDLKTKASIKYAPGMEPAPKPPVPSDPIIK